MIVSCPACASRYEYSNSLRAPGDVKITCRSCGNRWIELEAAEIIDIQPFRKTNPRTIAVDDTQDADIERLVQASREARLGFAAVRAERRRSTINWAIYTFAAFLPIGGLLFQPESVVAAAPITFKAYQQIGWDINIYGLEIRKVQQEHIVEKGVRVLTIKGDIVNVTGEIQRIPWLRFGLRDPGQNEVYTWTLDTAARPLRPGEVTGFITRVQAPPEIAKDLQIRFARSSEIGSNI